MSSTSSARSGSSLSRPPLAGGSQLFFLFVSEKPPSLSQLPSPSHLGKKTAKEVQILVSAWNNRSGDRQLAAGPEREAQG